MFIDWINRNPDYDGTDYDYWRPSDPDQYKWDNFKECQRNRKWRFPPLPWWLPIDKPRVFWFQLKNHPTIFSN